MHPIANRDDVDAPSAVVLLTGVYQNAGDALIAHRALAFARRARPDLRILELNRAIDPRQTVALERVKACVISGGPHWQADMRPRILPRIQVFIDAGVPITSWGGGWRSLTDAAPTRETRELMDSIAESQLPVGVRDDYTVNKLAEFGINAEMIGCPAWFGGTPRRFNWHPRRLVISASPKIGKSPSARDSLLASIEISRYLRWRPQVFFQHPLSWYQQTATIDLAADLASIQASGASIVDSKGRLSIMCKTIDSAAAHMGWRLHSHVYASTRGIPSLVISDDERAPNMARSMSFLAAKSHNDPMMEQFLESPKTAMRNLLPPAFDSSIAACKEGATGFWKRLCPRR